MSDIVYLPCQILMQLSKGREETGKIFAAKTAL